MNRHLLLFLSLLFSSCSLSQKGKPLFGSQKADEAAAAAAKAEPILFEWDGDRIPGAPSVRINLTEQKARIYKSGQQVGWTYVASGTSGHSTPTGKFSIMEKKADKASNLWGVAVDASGNTVNWNARNGSSRIPSGGRFIGAPMPHWMRLTSSGIGMHGGPIPNPGSPASHGCIRLPYAMAQHLYHALPEGTPVTVSY
jgi:lipoprotein-anchoring transpeptidase ErfK/SrfK